ncbi:bile acid:sodium symporter family protein [Altererythrobacter sp. MF3-039]|uniref:bile acid:sodium symporter family protein n=1 Tax=Altererythrobacter sp. MF3-039 TaxID=3252901 RepID=UPI00390C5E88
MAGRALFMRKVMALLSDPMIILLVIVTVLALAMPVTGETRAAMQQAANVAIFVLFLVNGIRVPRGEILRGLANWRFFLPLTVFVFGIMALAGLGLSHAASGVLPPLIALGFLFLGTLPSTIQSATSYTTLAGGNVALSVIGAALLNVIGVVVSAPLFALLGGGEAAADLSSVIVKIGLILLLPFVIGQVIQMRFRPWVVEHKSQVVWLDRFVIALAVFVAMSGAAEQGIVERLDGATWLTLLAFVIAYLLVANLGAWSFGGLLGLARQDRISFLFAASQKSVAVGAPMAAILFPPNVAGFVIAPVLLYHLLQLMLAAPLANWLAAHPR